MIFGKYKNMNLADMKDSELQGYFSALLGFLMGPCNHMGFLAHQAIDPDVTWKDYSYQIINAPDRLHAVKAELRSRGLA